MKSLSKLFFSHQGQHLCRFLCAGLGLGLLRFPLRSRISRTFYVPFCPYFWPEVIVKLTRSVSGHFSAPIDIGMNPIESNPGHISKFQGEKGSGCKGPWCNLLFIPQAFEGLLRTCLWRQCYQSCSALQNLRPGNQRSTGSDLIFQKF